MAVKVYAREPETVGELAMRVGKFIVTAPLKVVGYIFLFGIIALIVAGVTKSDAMISVTILGLVGFKLRRPIRQLVHVIRSRTSQPAPQDVTEEAASEESVKPMSATWIGMRVDLEDAPFILTEAERHRHCYMVGRTRSGKTTLIKRLIEQEMALGSGLSFIDPHGDAAQELLGYVPPERIEDVIYFDPTSDLPPAFNPLALPYERSKLTADLLSAFKMFFGDSWGPRMDHLLRFGILTLLADRHPHTLADLRRVLVNDDYREDLVANIQNEQLREFWANDFHDARQSIPAVLNKLSEFLTPMSPLERLFSNPTNHLDFPTILNGGKIFIANLAKGQLGDGPSRLLGGLIVTGIAQAALARVSVPESERKPHFLYVDEFHNYTVSSFETILSESGKYKLYLTMANQSLGQLGSALERSIFSNVANLISFQLSADDAPHLRREMHRSRIVVQLPETPDRISLEDFVAYQKQLYRDALKDEHLGMSRDEIRKRKLVQKAAVAGGFVASVAAGAVNGRLNRSRREEIERTLSTLDRDDLNVEALRELFPDYHFREETFPDVDDFINLAPHHGIARIERADNVIPFRAPLPDAPNTATREAILSRMTEVSKPSSSPRPLPEVAPVPARSVAPTQRKKPQPATSRTEDDYTY